MKHYKVYLLLLLNTALQAEPDLMPKGMQAKIAKGEKTAVVAFLDRKHENINARNQFWQTPLHVAAMNGQLDLVTQFIEKFKASIDVQDRDGYTPLMAAAQYGYKDVVKYLLKKGADKTYTTFWGDTAYDCAQNEIAEIYGGPFKEVLDLLK